MPERVFAIGDIHGCHIALRTLIRHVNPSQDDTVVILGDVVDRGPNSRDVIDQLIQLRNRVNLICILGNHDQMLLESLEMGFARETWLGSGGQETLNSYGGSLENIPTSHIEFLNSFLDYWQSETEIFVHANLEADVPLEEQTFPWLRWSRLKGTETPHPSGKRIICGHTSQRTGRPAILNGYVCIDTWPYGEWLTCFDTSNDMVYQAAQDGTVREPDPLAEIANRFEP